MRPTYLQFRNPKERTPDPYDVLVTANGKELLGSRKKFKTDFSVSERFKEVQSDKASFWRGPGSYDLSYMSMSKKRPGKVHVYKPFHIPGCQNHYFYYGSSLVTNDKNSILTQNKPVQRSRSTTASSKLHSTRKTIKSPILSFDSKAPMNPQCKYT